MQFPTKLASLGIMQPSSGLAANKIRLSQQLFNFSAFFRQLVVVQQGVIKLVLDYLAQMFYSFTNARLRLETLPPRLSLGLFNLIYTVYPETWRPSVSQSLSYRSIECKFSARRHHTHAEIKIRCLTALPGTVKMRDCHSFSQQPQPSSCSEFPLTALCRLSKPIS